MVIQTDTVKEKVIKMDTIGSRLRLERERLGLSQTAFAALAGASKPSQVRYEKGDRHPDGSYFEKVAAKGVDIQFVITGERNPTLADRSLPLAGDVRIDGEDYASIRVYDVDVAAGNGLVPSSEAVSDRIAFTRRWLMQHGVVADLAGLVRVRGDSMEPTIPDGSYVLVDRRAKADSSAPGIYISRLGDAIVVKRLQYSFDGKHKIATLISDNPMYPPRVVHDLGQENFQPLARVRAVITEL